MLKLKIKNKNIDKFKAIKLYFKKPSPFIWFQGKFFKSLTIKFDLIFILGIFQQLNWSFINLLKFNVIKKKHYELSGKIIFTSCILNSYTPSELSLMHRFGIKDYKKISKLLPDNKSNYFHKKNRYSWPNKCREVISILSNKGELLQNTPSQWRPKFIVSGIENLSDVLMKENWIEEELKMNGLILKPNIGFGSKGIVFYKYKDNVLKEKFLFRGVGSSKNFKLGSLTKKNLEKIWRNLINNKKHNILITPFYTNGIEFPSSFPSVTMRVITFKKNYLDKSKISNVWFDIPLSSGRYIFLDLKGNLISKKYPYFNNLESKEILIWQEFIKYSLPNYTDECLSGSTLMHDRLKNIDQIAWDWIPKGPHPILLEGNSGFGMFMPGLFNMLYSDK